ncbi:MAG TPA: hypothetical protein VEM35_11610, partial [Rhizomicrobium sp.]|nr:hypothetical protein [Rhizomicrobium sp.]
MRKLFILLGVLLLESAAFAAGTDMPPIWAYPVAPQPGPPAKPDNSVMKKLPGSKARFTEAGVSDRFNVPDWYPGDHPSMPNVVA